MVQKIIQIFFCVLFVTFLFAEEDSFNIDRLPVGNPDTKYDFCAVKLDKIYASNSDTNLDKDQLFFELKNNRIVLIGETHTNHLHHQMQLEIIKGLVESGKQVCLALEMFTPQQDSALQNYSRGLIDEEQFMEQADYFNTWGHNYRYYKPIFDYAREQKLKIYGVNIDHSYSSKIGRGGLSALTDEERNKIPEIDTTDIEHRFFVKVAMEGMDATAPQQFKNIYAAQCLWDAAMGDGAIRIARKNPDAVVVLLAGSGHVVYNLSIARIIRERSDFSFASVVAVDVPDSVTESVMMKVKRSLKKDKEKSEMNKEKDESDAKNKMPPMAMMHGMERMDSTPYKIVSRSLADYLWGVAELEKEKYPSFGFSIGEKTENGFPIKRVIPETLAEDNGLKRGDKILSIDNTEFSNLANMKKYLHFKNWDDEITFEIFRDNKQIEIKFTIE